MNLPLSALACSSVDRPIGLRARNDLQLSRSAGGGVIVSDLIASSHHELTNEEAALLESLTIQATKAVQANRADQTEQAKQTATLRELQKQYEQEFAPRRISFEELSSRLGSLHKAGLLVAEQVGQGDVLWQRREQRTSSQRRWAWAKLLSIRLPGIGPQPLLDRLSFVGRIAFSPFGAFFAFGLWTIALLILMGSASRFLAELPSLMDLASPLWLASLFVGIAVLKSLHELGHALACHRYGAEVREMGVLLLMFMPCLYSDVTDAWRLPSRWQRLMITLAGVVVELTLAAVAIVIWRFSEPGFVHTMALQIVLIASLATLLVNLNPLMRYDGYYLLSDLAETPNLWTRSRQAVTSLATDWLVKQDQNKPKREPSWIALYGFLSQLFLYSILVGFAWLLLAVSQALHAEVIGWGIIGLIGIGMVLPSLMKTIAWFRRPRHEQPVRKIRTALLAVGLAIFAYAIVELPLPNRIGAPAVVVPAESDVVAATLAGRLAFTLPIGTEVKAGEVIAVLESPELLRQQLAVESELASCELELELIEAQRTADPTIAAQIPTAKARIESCQKRLDELLSEVGRLTLRASRSGVLLTPSPRHLSDNDRGELPTWTGQLLSDAEFNSNLGAWIEVGDVVAMIVEPNAWEIELQVTDADTERLATGQSVRIALRQQTFGLLQGEVIEIGRQSQALQEEASANSTWAAQWLPLSKETVRKVRVQLKEHDSLSETTFVAGGLGEARIDAGRKSIGAQLVDLFNATFRLPY